MYRAKAAKNPMTPTINNIFKSYEIQLFSIPGQQLTKPPKGGDVQIVNSGKNRTLGNVSLKPCLAIMRIT